MERERERERERDRERERWSSETDTPTDLFEALLHFFETLLLPGEVVSAGLEGCLGNGTRLHIRHTGGERIQGGGGGGEGQTTPTGQAVHPKTIQRRMWLGNDMRGRGR